MGKPSLLVVSPLPPSWSGIARYTANLLPHLAKAWRLTVVVGDGETVDPELGVEDVEIVHSSSWRWFEPITHHDRILHCLGNSEFHRHVPSLVARHGGVVLAHEVRMNGLQCLRALQARDPHWLSAIVHQRHGASLGGEIRWLEANGGIAHQFHAIRSRLDGANVYLLAPAVRGADAIAVHSRYAASLAELDVQSPIKLHVVPFGHPTPCDHDRVVETTTETISSFGFVAPEKHSELLLEAFAILSSGHTNARLRYVGHVDEPYRDRLIERARHLGVDPLVTFTGRLTDDEYASEVCSASVAVQLRSSANGEASAAIADCLSAGLPTLVSRLGAQAELPIDAVEMVNATAGPGDVAVIMHRVLADTRRRETMSAAATRHAADCSFARAAETLTGLLLSAPPTR